MTYADFLKNAKNAGLLSLNKSIKGGGPIRMGNVGKRFPFGRKQQAIVAAGFTTYQVTAGLVADFDSVVVVFSNCDGTNSPYCAAVAASVISDQTGDLNNSAGTWVQGSIAGQATMPLALAATPFAASTAETFTFSDPIPVRSIPRTDGKPGALVVVRALFNPSDNLTQTMYGNGVQDFTNWANRTDGQIWAAREQALNGVTTPTTFTSTTNTSRSPIVGLLFLARGMVVNVAGLGDSIVEGQGTYIGEGYIMPACVNLAAQIGIPISYSNFGWSGQPMLTFSGYGFRGRSLLFEQCKPDILFVESATFNDLGGLSNPVTASIADGWRQWLAELLRTCKEEGVVAIPVTQTPSNSSVYNVGATDSLRLANNALTLNMRTTGYQVLDAGGILAGGMTSGQQQMMAGSTTDGVHPNDTGNALIVPAAAVCLRNVLGV